MKHISWRYTWTFTSRKSLVVEKIPRGNGRLEWGGAAIPPVSGDMTSYVIFFIYVSQNRVKKTCNTSYMNLRSSYTARGISRKRVKSWFFQKVYPQHGSEELFDAKKTYPRKLFNTFFFFLKKFQKWKIAIWSKALGKKVKSQIFEKVCPSHWS